METLLFPGFSLKNKDWAENVRTQTSPKLQIEINYYPHWQNGQAEEGWFKKEVDKILSEGQGKTYNLLAKSVGTIIGMATLSANPNLYQKMVLNGIPINDFSEGDDKYFEALKNVPAENVLVIQNESDPHGSYQQVEAFIRRINPNIKVVSKPRDDHDYPYPEDFISFLSS